MSIGTTLIQRRGLEKSTFTITENGVQVRHDRINRGGSCVVPYPAIPNTPTEATAFSEWAWAPAVVLTLLMFGVGAACLKPTFTDRDSVSGIVFLFFIVAGVTSYILSLAFHRRVYVFSDGTHTLTVDMQTPSTSEVKQFIERIDGAKLDYYTKKLKRARDMDPSANIKLAITSLLHNQLITEAQADQLCESLDATTEPEHAFGYAVHADARRI